MKKLLCSVLAIGLIGISGPAFATGQFFTPNNFGTIDVDSFSVGGGFSGDGEVLPGFTGAAFGGGVSFGKSKGYVNGFVFDGEVEGETGTVGGGFSDTNAYKSNNFVGSETHNFSTAEGFVRGSVDPDGGFGAVNGGFSGITGQGSLNGSFITGDGWQSFGMSTGVAGQGSIGAFGGKGWAVSGPDIGCGCFTVDSNAGFDIEAGFVMTGGSGSESYRYTQNNNGFYTEAMGTNVFAYTNVDSYGSVNTYKNGLGASGATLGGGFKAIGGANTNTVQGNGTGFAASSATGVYKGSGELGQNYEGSAEGYSVTSLTTSSGNGTISSSAAGMKVSSRFTSGQPQ